MTAARSTTVCCTMVLVALAFMADFAHGDGTYAIFGTVTGQDGAPVSGVVLSFQEALSSQTTDDDGKYQVTGAASGRSYTITPARAAMSFSPASRTVTIGSGDERVDFVGVPPEGTLCASAAAASARTRKVNLWPDVLSPVWGDVWKQGKSYNIRWTYDGYHPPLRIRLLKGGAPHMVIALTTPNDGSFWWKVPATIAPATDYAIEVTDQVLYADTGGKFTIESAPLVTYPNNAGVSWRRGQSYKIQWQGFGGSHVKIQLYRAGSLNRLISWATPNDGSFWWKVPYTQAKGTTFKIKITGQSKTVVYDFSDKNFTIAGVQKVTWPTAPGIDWRQGQAKPITWQGYVGPNVRIELLKGWAVHKVITTGTPNDGKFWWKMPWATTPGTDYRIRVISANDPTQKDHSNNNFTVVPVPHVNYPSASGIIWGRGMTYTIKWSGYTVNKILILLYRDGVGQVAEIADGTPNDGRFVWRVPDNIATGEGYRILVGTSYKGDVNEDMSDNPFSIYQAVPAQ